MSWQPDRLAAGEQRRLVFVSDLHLGLGTNVPTASREPPEAFLFDDELADLIDSGASGPDRVDALLLLGDFLELPGAFDGRIVGHRREVELPAMLDRLGAIAHAHRPVFEALGRYVSSGGAIHVVPGNHDPLLGHPVIFDGLTGIIAGYTDDGSSAARITLHRWVFHVPGVVYAEHGHQHDVLSAFRSPQRPWSVSAHRPNSVLLEDTVGAALHRALADAHRPDRAGPRPRVVVREGGARTWALLRDATDVEPFDDIGGISAATLAALHHDSRPTGRRAVRMLGQRLWSRWVGDRARATAPYLHRAGALIHRELQQAGVATPVYAFGHSHRPEMRTIAAGATYVNGGSWASWGRPPGAGTTLPYGEIVVRDGAVNCAVRCREARTLQP